MKFFRFNLTNDFQLNEISRTNFYEKESNSSIVLIKGENNDFIYNMHFVNGDVNVVMPIDYAEGYFTCKIPDNILSNKGTARMQLRAFDGDVAVESNIIEFDIEEFLNASGTPTPEEITIIEKLQIEVKAISDGLNSKANKTTVDALSDKVDTKADIDDVNALGARVDTLDSETLDIYSKLELKADAISVYDKDTIDAQLNAKANKTDVYSKTDAVNKFANKVDTNNALNKKLDKTTIATTTVPGLIKTDTKRATYVSPSDGILTAIVMAGESGYNSLLDTAFISKGTLDSVLARLPKTSGMQFYKVTYEGGNIEHEGVALNYNQLVAKYNDPNYFLYCEAYGLTFIPSFPPIVGDEVLAFINTCIYGGAVTVSRIIINSDNEVKYSDEVLAKQSDFSNLESRVNNHDNMISSALEGVGNLGGEVTTIKADLNKLVSTEPQALTEAQKAQVRQNIGVGESGTVDEVARAEISEVKNELSNDVVHYDIRTSNNLYDYLTMCQFGGWFVKSGNKVIYQENQYTGGYGAITIEIDGITDVTIKTNQTLQMPIYNYFIADNENNILYESGAINVIIDTPYTISNSVNGSKLCISMRGYNAPSIVNKNVIMINKGTVALPFEDYYEPVKIKPWEPTYIYDTDDEFTILTKLTKAFYFGNVTVIFEKSTYVLKDIYTYMKDVLGIYWTLGLPIGNGCKYYLNGSTIISNSPDGYSDFRMIFDTKLIGSDFEMYDGILINNGGTYCVHDEAYNSRTPYIHKYHNITMINNYGSTTTSGNKAFGCGIGFDATIVFNNCCFENNGIEDYPMAIHGATTNPNIEPTKLDLVVSNSFFNKLSLSFNTFHSNVDDWKVRCFGNAWKSDVVRIDGIKYIVANNTILN